MKDKIDCFACSSTNVKINKEGNPLDGTGDWECECSDCGASWFTVPHD